jgi:hypothetical protein
LGLVFIHAASEREKVQQKELNRAPSPPGHVWRHGHGAPELTFVSPLGRDTQWNHSRDFSNISKPRPTPDTFIEVLEQWGPGFLVF